MSSLRFQHPGESLFGLNDQISGREVAPAWSSPFRLHMASGGYRQVRGRGTLGAAGQPGIIWSMAKREQTLLGQIEQDLLDGKPLADVLRKVIMLGGKAGSSEMRDWASLELNGYAHTDAPIPNYRHVPAGIFLDSIVGPRQISGQRVGPLELPTWLRDNVKEMVELPMGVAELEHLVNSEDGTVRISMPAAGDVVAVLNSESDQPFQQIIAIYWKLSTSSVRGVVDKVRTKLAELVAELTAATPDGAAAPSAEQAAAAVSFVVTGKRNTVVLSSAQSTGGGYATSMLTPMPSPDTEPQWWTLGRKIGAFVVGCSIIVGAVVTVLLYKR
jgi:AbiTii